MHMLPELLETRIAPAAVLHYVDPDGDKVTVKTSSGNDAQLAAIVTLSTVGTGQQLDLISFSSDAVNFAGTSLTISVKKHGGDGLTQIGFIDAGSDNGGTAIDLGKVKIKGNLLKLAVGDTDLTTNSMKSLQLYSFEASQPGTDLIYCTGSVGSFKVKHDIDGGRFYISGDANGNLGSAKIGGSILGGDTLTAGSLRVSGSVQSIKVGGDVSGGVGGGSGLIEATFGSSAATVGKVTIGGSIKGGGGPQSGQVSLGAVTGDVKVGGDVTTGTSTNTGELRMKSAHAIVVKGSLTGGGDDFSGFISVDDKVGDIFIKGDILGGDGKSSGSIDVENGIGDVNVKGELRGSGGENSGRIQCRFGTIGDVSIGGSVIGDAGPKSGWIDARDGIGNVVIHGSLAGGSISNSGDIYSANGPIGNVTILGSILGGTADFTGRIVTGLGNIGKVVVSSDLQGGAHQDCGLVSSGGSIKSVVIGNNVNGDNGLHSGGIVAQNQIGYVHIKGSAQGFSPAVPVVISANGANVETATTDLAIKSVTVDHNFVLARILGGYDAVTGTAVNADAQIGSVLVKGNWLASSVIAGVKDVSANGFGNVDDAKIPDVNDSGTIVSRIASVVIKGFASGNGADLNDHYGIVAQEVVSLKIGGNSFPLQTDPANDDLDANDPALLIGTDNDFRVHEVAL